VKRHKVSCVASHVACVPATDFSSSSALLLRSLYRLRISCLALLACASRWLVEAPLCASAATAAARRDRTAASSFCVAMLSVRSVSSTRSEARILCHSWISAAEKRSSGCQQALSWRGCRHGSPSWLGATKRSLRGRPCICSRCAVQPATESQ